MYVISPGDISRAGGGHGERGRGSPRRVGPDGRLEAGQQHSLRCRPRPPPADADTEPAAMGLQISDMLMKSKGGVLDILTGTNNSWKY